MAKLTVEIQPPMSYVPASVDVSVGDTVEWVSRDSTDIHTVTSDDGTTFSSAILNENDTFAHTFAAAGDFPYHCEVHGAGMAGVVKVKAAAARHTVEIIAPMTYSPATLQIKAGETVEWISQDSTDIHTVTSDDGTSFTSAIMNQNDKFEHTFTTAGNFPYHCEVHGSGMAGVINVT